MYNKLMLTPRPKSITGFTLIELLVVIAIIGTLATMVLVSLSDVRGKARDARRESDIRQINLAMELEYSEKEQYQRVEKTPVKIPSDSGKYLDPVPKDPLGDDYYWRDNRLGSATNCDGQQYCVYAKLELGGYFAASEKGAKRMEAPPPAGPTKCCW